MMFFPPAIMDINFTVDEIEETDIKVTAQPERDDISVGTSIAFCLRSRKKCLPVWWCSAVLQFELLLVRGTATITRA